MSEPQDNGGNVRLNDRLDRAASREWNQSGFAVIANSPIHDGLPMVMGFYLPKWEAESRMRQLNDCPKELQLDLQIVPASLAFKAPGSAV